MAVNCASTIEAGKKFSSSQEQASRRRIFDITVGIPAYSRPSELQELIESIYLQTVLPAEITICEDNSADRPLIRPIVDQWRARFAKEGCTINYHENETNLGYDGNLRKVIGMSRSRWVMLMGNDDVLLKRGIETAESFLLTHDDVTMVSRSFLRFDNDIEKPVGVSRIASMDTVFRADNSSSKMVFRSCGFVGGLIVSRNWAADIATDWYDGTLYYQIYLACVSFCEKGIGYIVEPIIGGRRGAPPLFGAAESEKGSHIPGSYTPKGRAKMWASVLTIARDVGEKRGVDLRSEIKRELEVRQSFHVFEMTAGSGRKRLEELRDELRDLDLYSHPVPRTLFLLNWVLGSKARPLYALARKLMQ
jgi:abequosyltransferase